MFDYLVFFYTILAIIYTIFSQFYEMILWTVNIHFFKDLSHLQHVTSINRKKKIFSLELFLQIIFKVSICIFVFYNKWVLEDSS